MAKELVSIITPTYNCAHFIAETIHSVLAQTYTYWEMIIVDDCSTDNTEDIVKKFASIDPRIRYLRNYQNMGAASTRNRALREAKGRWIAFLDSDDLWMPSKLERQISFMKHNGYTFSYHEYEEIDKYSNPLHIYVSGPKNIGKIGMTNFCWPGCLTVMYDVNNIGLIQIENILKNNDYAIWLKAISKANCHLLKENLAMYRRRAGSISNCSYTQLITWHYRLFREAQGQNTILAMVNTCRNIIGAIIKKIIYIQKK